MTLMRLGREAPATAPGVGRRPLTRTRLLLSWSFGRAGALLAYCGGGRQAVGDGGKRDRGPKGTHGPAPMTDVEGTWLRPILAGMAKKSQPPKPIRWDIYGAVSKAKWIGEVEATDEFATIERAAEQFKVPAT